MQHPTLVGRRRLLCAAIFAGLLALLALGGSATAAVNTSQLSVQRHGYGHGSITSSPVGIDCGTTCQANVVNGSSVTLTAVATADSTFTGWTGACVDTSTTCTVAVSAATAVTGTFTLRFPVTLTATWTGSGLIVSDPLVILCGDSFYSCQGDVAMGSTVRLQGVPATGWFFSGWSGACAGQAAICTISVSEATSVNAIFSPLERVGVYALGSGRGTVTSSPAGLTCGLVCQVDVVSGTVVTLTAVASPGSIFAGWGGDCAGSSPTCTLSMVTPRMVTATFTPPPVHFSVTKTGTGSGSVRSSLGGIDCGVACEGVVPYFTIVTLTPVAAPGSTFTGWGGACFGNTATTCTLAPYAGDSITANFDADLPAPPVDPPATDAPPAPDVGTPAVTPAAAVIPTVPVADAASAAQPLARATARPKLRARPRVSGRPRAGRVLVCSRGSWSGSPSAYVFTWRRAGKAIAHGSRHLVRPTDRGRSLRCDVTATNARGASTATSLLLRVPR